MKPIVRTAVLVLVLVAASAAHAGPFKIQTARFQATLSGSQSTAWTVNAPNGCGSTTGSGKQTFSYHQKRAVTLVFWRYLDHDGPPNVSVAQDRSNGIAVTGTASREGTLNYSSNGKCPPGQPIGPPQDPPAPDCGTVHYNGFFYPNWRRPNDFAAAPGEPVPLDNAFTLDEPSPPLQWLHCPFDGPLIIQRLSHVLLPEKTVFGSRKRINLHDSVHRIDQTTRVAQGVVADTTVQWTMHLTRIR